MRLTEILQPDCVKVPLAANTKQAAIYELVDLLADVADISDPDQLRKAVWQREMTRTTGIGHGIAIPHGKVVGCSQICMAVGKPASPIDFSSIDGEPVELIILMASPVDQTGPHIQLLAQISRMLTDEDFRGSIRSAEAAQAVYDLIAQQEAKAAV